MTTPTSTPGTLALDTIQKRASGAILTVSPELAQACEADLRALMAERDAAIMERDKLFKLYEELGDKYRPLTAHAERLTAVSVALAFYLDAILIDYSGTNALGAEECLSVYRAALAAWRNK